MDQAKASIQAGNVADGAAIYQKIIDESPDGDRTAEAMYLLAEISNNIEKQPLKAAALYEQIPDRFPKTEFAHKALYLAAFTYAEALQNLDKARPLYERYLKDYPDSSFAKSARIELDNLGRSADEVLQSLQQSAQTPAAAEAPKN